MVAPLIAAAGIGAASSLIGSITGGKGAKKQAKIAQQAQRESIAAAERNRDYQYNLNAPTISRGGAADDRIAALLRLGASPQESAHADEAFNAWRDSTGYQTVRNDALSATNQRAFAGGVGQSGAAARRLQETAGNLANGTFRTYMGDLNAVSGAGGNARALVAGVGGNATNQIIGATQVGAAGEAAAAQAGTENVQRLIQNLANTASYAYGSSYSQPSGSAPSAFMLPRYGGGDYRYPGSMDRWGWGG